MAFAECQFACDAWLNSYPELLDKQFSSNKRAAF